MRRLLALIACLSLSACGTGTTAVRPTPTPCELHLPAAPAPGQAPLAVLRDISSGPSEYLLGSPGGAVLKIDVSTGSSPPQLAGGSLFFSVRHGQVSSVYRGALGGCARRLAEGTLGNVEPGGRALTVLVGTHWTMIDGQGRRLAAVTGAAGSWTADGRLIEPATAGVDIFDLSGKKRSISLAAVAPLGSLGAHQELMSTATGIQVLDIETGRLTPVNPALPTVLRGGSGSPDGNHVAYLDQPGVGRVLDLQTGTSRPLPSPALTTGFTWSHDSRWIGVQTVYGGAELRLADNVIVDSGSLVTVSW
ncbi:MAG TPA: hypothetical protein VIN56_03960 [Candidatus Dormibacteraeota bacterium]